MASELYASQIRLIVLLTSINWFNLYVAWASFPENADFGVNISGDSMEPQFINGQTVWVHAQNTLEPGEIGIFFHNGEGFIKKLGNDGEHTLLISLNHRKYEPRIIRESDEFLVFGKVVG